VRCQLACAALVLLDRYDLAGQLGRLTTRRRADVEDPVAEELGQHLLRVGALDLDRRHIDLLDGDVHPLGGGDPHRVEVHVRVGEREPELVLLDPEQHGVVQDPAVRARDENVLGLVDGTLVEVARHDHVRQIERVLALDLDLLLDADVPERHPVHQVPVLGDGVAVVPRVVGVVVDAVARDAVAARRVEVGRLADPRVEQDPGVVVHGHRCNSFPLCPKAMPEGAHPRGPTKARRRRSPQAGLRSTRSRASCPRPRTPTAGSRRRSRGRSNSRSSRW